MNDGEYELVINPEYEDFNLELLKDYWESSDFEKHQFTYPINKIMKKHNIKSITKLERIVKNSGHFKYRALKDCQKCYFEYELFIRKDLSFKRWNSYQDKLVCHDCFKVFIQKVMPQYLTEFKSCISDLPTPLIKPPKYLLSYIEKIIIYVMLNKVKIGVNNVLSKREWLSFIELEVNGANDFIEKIFEKGYLFKTNSFDRIIENQNTLRKMDSEFKQYFNDNIKEEIQIYLNLNFDSEIILVLPEEHKTLKGWMEYLYEEIITSKLSISECKDLEKFIINKRLLQVYALLDFITISNNIPVKKNKALDLTLIKMLKKFNLENIFSVFSYQAKMTKSRLYELEHGGYSNAKYQKDYVFEKKISSYLNFLEKKNEKPKFSIGLSEYWKTSEIEIFVSKYVTCDNNKWDKFTPNEILALWVEAVGMRNEEDNM